MSKSPARSPKETALGTLPAWDLSHLYPAIDSPEVATDLREGLEQCKQFEDAHKGRLEALIKGRNGPGRLAVAIGQYEAIEDRLGRLISYAGLIYASDTTNPVHAKFYGDVQEKITTASSHLLFFTLELNRLDDQLLDKAMLDAKLAHWAPWLQDIRREKPYQLDDRIEQLFHEKSVTGRGAWNRLFDETMASLRFKVDGQDLPLEPTLNYLQDTDETKRHAAADALAETLAANARLFTLITNTLAKDKEIADRWRNFQDVADSRHLANRVEREVVDALVSAVRAAYPRLSHRYYRLKARWFGKDQLP
ncbi:MAG: M3 family oligoendopeptidase, partial [Hyphomicrobiales bacterium]